MPKEKGFDGLAESIRNTIVNQIYEETRSFRPVLESHHSRLNKVEAIGADCKADCKVLHRTVANQGNGTEKAIMSIRANLTSRVKSLEKGSQELLQAVGMDLDYPSPSAQEQIADLQVRVASLRADVKVLNQDAQKKKAPKRDLSNAGTNWCASEDHRLREAFNQFCQKTSFDHKRTTKSIKMRVKYQLTYRELL